jgi:hypothetical protein
MTLQDIVRTYWAGSSVLAVADFASRALGRKVSCREVWNAKQAIDCENRPGLQMKGSGDATNIPLRDRDAGFD